MWYHHNFNKTVKRQLKNHKTIPIIIISFNQLKFLKLQVEFLLKHGYSNIIIVDNCSNYKPLLDYFGKINKDVTIYRLNKNLGHLTFWKDETIFKKYSTGYYVVSDADIVPVNDCPEDFIKELRLLLDKAYGRTKVGFSLMLDDIPDTNPNKEHILHWESKYYKTKIHPLAFKAEIDTTFAIYRPKYRYKLKHFTKAWRTDYPMQARHGGWYIDPINLSEEQKQYLNTANDSASWLIDEKGILINKVHNPLYSND